MATSECTVVLASEITQFHSEIFGAFLLFLWFCECRLICVNSVPAFELMLYNLN